MIAAAPRDGTLRGIGLMCLGVAMFPFLNASAKLLTEDYPIAEIVCARFAGHFVWVSLLFFPRHGWRLFVPRRPLVHIVRSCLLLASTAFFVSAIGRIPLATASAIGFTTPFIVTALSVPMLAEPVGVRRWVAVGIGFLGALIVIRPQPTGDNGAMLLVLCNATCYSLYQIFTRKAGTHDSAETAIVYAALVGTVAMLIIAPFFGPRLPTRPLDIVLFAGLGFFGGFGHYFVGRAFQLAPAALISPFGYLELIGTTIIGYILFRNFPDGWTWVGVAIIVVCGIYVGYRERLARAKARDLQASTTARSP